MRKVFVSGFLMFIAAVLTSCGGSGSSTPLLLPTCTISGTLTFADNQATGASLNGETLTFVIDSDGTADNGNEAKTFTPTWSGGSTYKYSFDITSLDKGQYYLYAIILPPGFTVYGWYGAEEVNDYHSPQVPVEVKCGSKYSFNIEIT